MKSLKTVNVIEDADGQLSITSFPDTKAGNKSAEALFSRIAKENIKGISKADLEVALEDGYVDGRQLATWDLYIIHSVGRR